MISSLVDLLLTIVKMLGSGLKRLLPVASITHEVKTEEHPNKRKHNQLDQEDDAADNTEMVEKEAKKWRPDSAYVSIQLFIRKMFGAPDPNGNLDRDTVNNDENLIDSEILEDGASKNWNLKPDCQFIAGENEDDIPFSVKKTSSDENLNKTDDADDATTTAKAADNAMKDQNEDDIPVSVKKTSTDENLNKTDDADAATTTTTATENNQ